MAFACVPEGTGNGREGKVGVMATPSTHPVKRIFRCFAPMLTAQMQDCQNELAWLRAETGNVASLMFLRCSILDVSAIVHKPNSHSR